MSGNEANLDGLRAARDGRAAAHGHAPAMHEHLRHHENQVRAGVAEIHIGHDLAGVRLRPGDLVTTVAGTYTVGGDGRCYAGATAAAPPPGLEIRVYRRMGHAFVFSPAATERLRRRPSHGRISGGVRPSPPGATPPSLRRWLRHGGTFDRTPDRRGQADRSPGVGTMDDFIAQAEEKLRQIEEVQRTFERTEVTGHSRNNAVTAKMRGSGQLTDVSIDPRVLQRYDAKALGGFVVEAVNDALRRLGETTQAMWAPLMAEAGFESTG